MRGIEKREAKLILKYMNGIVKDYGFVTVADFNDLLGYTRSVYTDNCKGWHSLKGAKIKRKKLFSRKYVIILPEPIPISD